LRCTALAAPSRRRSRRQTGASSHCGRVTAAYAHHVAIQIVVRIRDRDLAAIDQAVEAGRFPSRAAAVQEALERLLADERERQIADDYRRAYAEHPEEDRVGRLGDVLMAQSIEELERNARS
jgi:Arc/MetJ-type ribon-helix-helix transcriptional regulator